MTRYVFICYALQGERLDRLRERIELITRGAADAGLRTYAHIRDAQQWNVGDVSMKQVLDRAFGQISGAEAVLLDLTGGIGSKRVGLNIEAGYAKALKKPIFALWREPERPDMTTDLADFEAAYRRNEDLRRVTHRLFADAMALRDAMAARDVRITAPAGYRGPGT